jgi:hypothetical protein
MARVTLALCPTAADSLDKGLRVIDHLRVVSFPKSTDFPTTNFVHQYVLCGPATVKSPAPSAPPVWMKTSAVIVATTMMSCSLIK